jgi:hypothetical protein
MSGSLTTNALIVDNATVNLNTGGNTLSLTSGGADVGVTPTGSLTFSGNLAGSGAADFDLSIGGSANFQNGSIVADGDIVLAGGGTMAASNLTITPGGGDFTVSGTSISPGGDGGIGTVTVDGDMGGTGTWIFDAVDISTSDLVNVTGELDVSGFVLNLSGAATGANLINPIIIANYGNASEPAPFFNVLNLPAGKRIDYNFNGNSIAIVPEVTYAFPLLLAFLPLMGRRSRK